MEKKSTSLYALLGVLSLGPHSGYEIKKLIEQSLAHFWQEGYGQIYPNLKRLVELELATVELKRQDGKPDKKVYTITDLGENQLKDWLQTPVEQLPKEKHEILLKLFFGKNVDTLDNIAHVTLYQQRMEKVLIVYRQIEKALQISDDNDLDNVYQLMTVRNGIFHAKATLDWCEETIEVLKKLSEKR